MKTATLKLLFFLEMIIYSTVKSTFKMNYDGNIPFILFSWLNDSKLRCLAIFGALKKKNTTEIVFTKYIINFNNVEKKKVEYILQSCNGIASFCDVWNCFFFFRQKDVNNLLQCNVLWPLILTHITFSFEACLFWTS